MPVTIRFNRTTVDPMITDIQQNGYTLNCLTNFSTYPFYIQTDSLLDSIYREVNSPYELNVDGDEFEYFFLRDFDRESIGDRCLSVSHHPRSKPQNVTYSPLPYYNGTNTLPNNTQIQLTHTPTRALVINTMVTNVDNCYAQIEQTEGIKFILCRSNTRKLTHLGNLKFKWEWTTNTEFEAILNAIHYRFCRVYNVGAVPLPQIRVNLGNDIRLGESITPTYTVTNGMVDVSRIQITSNNPNIVQIDRFNRIIGQGKGTTQVKFYRPDSNEPFCTKTIEVYIAPTDITLSLSQNIITVGDSFNITCSIATRDADQSVKFRYPQDQLSYSSVTNSFTAKKTGKVTVTAQFRGGAQKTITFTVYAKPKEINVTLSDTDVFVGDKITVDLSILPANALQSTIYYRSQKPSIVSTEKNPKTGRWFLRAKSAGTCEISFYTQDRKLTRDVEITVRNYDSRIPRLSYIGIFLAVLSLFWIKKGVAFLDVLHLLAQGYIAYKAIKEKWQEKIPSIYTNDKLTPGKKNTLIASCILLIWSFILLL